MTAVTGFTAARMLEIEAGTVTSGEVDGSGNLILTKHDGSTVNAGSVKGPMGDTGPEGESIAHGVRVRSSTGTGTLASDVVAGIYTFDTEDFDTDGYHNNLANKDRLTVPSVQAGIYSVTAYFSWGEVDPGPTCLLLILKNDSLALVRHDGKDNSFTGNTLCWTGYLAEGDYVQMAVYHTNGSPVSIDANEGTYPSDPPSPVFEMWKVSGPPA
jgi:hypothetical protein